MEYSKKDISQVRSGKGRLLFKMGKRYLDFSTWFCLGEKVIDEVLRRFQNFKLEETEPLQILNGTTFTGGFRNKVFINSGTSGQR